MKTVNDEVQKNIDNPEIIITNKGPVKATSLTVDFIFYTYNKNLAVVDTFSRWKMETHEHFIFLKELQPAEDMRKQLLGIHGKDIVGIYEFILKYYREKDMKVFDEKELFFIDNYEIYSQKDYTKKDHYQKNIEAIKSPKSTPNKAGVNLKVVADHTWFVTESKPGIYNIKPNGGLMIGDNSMDPLSLIKQNSLDKNRSLLYVHPVKFKKTENYINSEIVNNDTVNLELRFELENVGDMEAINISQEDDTAFYKKSLKPGETTYPQYKVMFTKKATGSNKTPYDLLKDMDKEDYFFEYKRTLFYSQEPGNRKNMTRFIYKIGKNSVKLIKYEIQ